MPIQRRFKKPVTVESGDRLFDIERTAKYLGGIHPQTVRQMIRDIQLPHVRIGKRIFLDRLDLDRYIEQQKNGALAA